MKYAVLKYSGHNVGDDIQSLALERLLPRVDYRVDRDDMGQAKEWGDDVRWIINGWFAPTEHKVWPPPGNAIKLFLGFHAALPGILPRNELLPIGCRDPWTLNLCNQNGIDAWLSWCLTLTLQRPDVPRDDSVILADMPKEYLDKLPANIARGTKISHHIPKESDRLAEVVKRLDLYARARWVVTTRLHVFLPCVAFNTPVVYIRPPASENRFFGYLHLRWKFTDAPWDDPRPKADPELVRHLAQPLRDAVRRFIES